MTVSLKSNVNQESLGDVRESYMLPHNKKEIDRMKCQHEWIKGALGGLIKASVDYNRKNQKILDSATADGTWLFDACTLFPQETELVGFDIAPELFQTPESLPENVSLVVMDLTSELPAEWMQQFDFVHQRFVFPGLPETTVRKSLSNLMGCVKPGGWIQLIEPAANENVSGPDPTAFHVLHKFADACMKTPNPREIILSQLKAGGFVNINVQSTDIVVGSHQVDRELDVRGRKCMRAAVTNMSAIANAEMLGLTELEWDHVLDRFEDDMNKYRTAVRHTVIWAQSPSDM